MASVKGGMARAPYMSSPAATVATSMTNVISTDTPIVSTLLLCLLSTSKDSIPRTRKHVART